MIRICFIALFLLSGCRATQVVSLNEVALATTGPVGVYVQSFGGSVSIIADPTVLGTIVSANQHEEGVGAVPVARLYMECSTFIENGPLGEVIHVNAVCDNDPLHLVTANIVVRARDIHGVTVLNRAGDIIVQGASGPLHIETSDGSVRVVTPLVMNEDVLIENRRGDIIYRVRSESSGLIDATAIGGEATLDLRQGNAVILHGSTGDRLKAQFNDGVNPLVMRTFQGDIRIHVNPDPIGSEPLFSTDWISW